MFFVKKSNYFLIILRLLEKGSVLFLGPIFSLDYVNLIVRTLYTTFLQLFPKCIPITQR